MGVYQAMDDLIREYLVFRGFAATLKSFDSDLKIEKEKAFRPDRILDQIMVLISSYDLNGLKELWNHFETKLFVRLDPVQSASVTKLEAGLLKLYVINCIQTKRAEKLKEFFEKMTPELHTQQEWRDWFALPFIINPETHPTFTPYFSRQWQDTLLLSLHNLLSLVFACVPPPKLADFNSTNVKIKRLREENSILKNRLMELSKNADPTKLELPVVPLAQDVMDDFFIVAQEASSQGHLNSESQVKGLKSFLRNFTTSPSTNAIKKSQAKSNNTDRSLSRTKTGGKPHAPLARVSQTSINSQQLLKGVNEDNPDSKTAFLLLSQEEYGEHNSEITHCKFSKSSGNLIASSDVDGVVKIWSASPRSPHTLATFISNSGVSALDWLDGTGSADRYFAYGTVTGTVRICDQMERKTAQELNVGGCVCFLESSPNSTLVAVSTSPALDAKEGGSLGLYDVRTGNKIEHSFSPTICGASAASPVVTSSAFNHNSQMITTGATDGKIRIFDLRRRDCISSWSVDNSDPIVTIQPSVDDTSVYVLTEKGGFSMWSIVQTSQKLFGVNIQDEYFDALLFPRKSYGAVFTFTGDSRHFVSCSTNGGVVHQIKSEEEIEKVIALKGHGSHATCTDWSLSTDHGPCVTGGYDGRIKVSTLLSQ